LFFLVFTTNFGSGLSGLGQVNGIFRRKGAYSRYKELLNAKGLLDKWYKYEDQRTKEELRAWCAENDIELTD
jgi:hypothetical protein